MRALSLDALTLLPLADWLALALFFVGWVGYAAFARRRAATRPSILGLTNRARHAWMLRATARDNRVFDGVVTQNLSSSPAFFASTTILIIGGLLAVLGTADKAAELARERTGQFHGLLDGRIPACFSVAYPQWPYARLHERSKSR